MSDTKSEFFKDLLIVQRSIETIKKNADNPFFKKKYLDLMTLLEVVKPVLNDNNFVLMQLPRFCKETQKNLLNTKIIHASGEIISAEIEIFCKDNTDPQKLGSGITYVRRYSITSMLGIAEKDDDGNSGSETEKTTSTNRLYSQAQCKYCGDKKIYKTNEDQPKPQFRCECGAAGWLNKDGVNWKEGKK